jgi:hypothetical protein
VITSYRRFERTYQPHFYRDSTNRFTRNVGKKLPLLAAKVLEKQQPLNNRPLSWGITKNKYFFIRSIAMLRTRQFFAVLSSFFHSSCYTLSSATLIHRLFFHPFSLYFAIYFLVYILVLLFPNSYTLLFREFYFLPCPNQQNQCSLTVSVTVGFLTITLISLSVNNLQFSLSLSYTGSRILLYRFLQEFYFIAINIYCNIWGLSQTAIDYLEF